MSKSTVLIVEDDRGLLEANRLLLEAEGFEVLVAQRLVKAREWLSVQKPDMIVLDIMLPDGNGIDFLAELRRTSAVPVLILTALDGEGDVVNGLEAGGDDYLTKPFSRSVFLARVHTMLRRARAAEVVKYGPLTFHMQSLSVYLNGADMMLTQRDFALLRFLVQHESRFLSAEYLYEQVWQLPMNQDTQAVRSAASRLRTKLAGSGYTIVSERGKGYCFQVGATSK